MLASYRVARDPENDAEGLLRSAFPGLLARASSVVFADSSQRVVWGLTGLSRSGPVLELLTQTPPWSQWSVPSSSAHLLLVWNPGEKSLAGWKAEGGAAQGPQRLDLPPDLVHEAIQLCLQAAQWGGSLLPGGVHAFDPRHPSPGPHFGTNLLLGQRSGFPHPLQTTPKSVVDGWGRGSFRAHSTTQVLATRWDLRQEENGFPANRQFYLTEGGRQVFFSADPGVAEVRCEHRSNRTVIRHRTDGLSVERTFALLPQEPGLPLACEVQQIRLTNEGSTARALRLVSTGMFGPSKPGALMEDVLYSTIILQAGVLRAPDGGILALSPDYYPLQDRDDLRFHTLRVRTPGGLVLAREMGTNLERFLAGGTLERPRGLAFLGNHLDRRGPGFFALAAPVSLAPGESVVVETFTGLVSRRGEGVFDDSLLAREVTALLDRFAPEGSLARVWDERDEAFSRYTQFLQVNTGNSVFDDGVNRNLPFQILYQSWASRSFCQTQKGYREIGFREIQDLFAGMLYFQAEGKLDLVVELLGEWASQVHEFGFANHNFYWVGKEPGLWSDDALWLIQAVVRYIDLSGDTEVLSRTFPMADGGERRLFDTLKAILRYSGEISVGAHGLPLLDRADWNDCLKIDTKTWSGPEKQAHYLGQSAEGTLRGGGLNTDFSESVMNAFLLKLAADQLAGLARLRSDRTTADWAHALADRVAQACQFHAWKKDWFCRLLVNRPNPHPFIGAAGDGLASDETDGTFFLNSFSWAILSRTAREDQIGPMFEVLEKRLKTPHGYRLVSSIDLRRVEPTVASAEYFPGDRENGAVFKHASMMAVSALFEAASLVRDRELARRMAQAGWWMIDLVVPSGCLEDPFRLGGNPRFCTQYTNSETGQHIGPLLSGTAPWLALGLLKAWGLRITSGVLSLDPLLREADTAVDLTLKVGDATWQIAYRKPQGFFRMADALPQIRVDGREAGTSLTMTPGSHRIEVTWSAHQ